MIDETRISFIYSKRGKKRKGGFSSFFVISVFFIDKSFSFILTNPLKYLFSSNLNNLHTFFLYSIKAHMFSSVVDGLYELEAWIITRRSWISKNTYSIFRKKNQNLVQRFHGMIRYIFYLIFFFKLFFLYYREIVPTVN
jgi:hypothetical protein